MPAIANEINMLRCIILMMICSLAGGCLTHNKAVSMYGPYLESMGPSEMIVRWVAESGDLGVVQWGKENHSDNRLQIEPVPYRYIEDLSIAKKPLDEIKPAQYSNVWFYAARLNNLKPGTEYQYRVTYKGKKHDAKFRTFPSEQEPFNFIVFSDVHIDEVVAKWFPHYNPSFLINCGDLVDREHLPQYLSFFSPDMIDATKSAPMYVARGNHDQSGKILEKLFTYPAGRLYYSFDYANVHFVCLDACLWRWPNGDEDTKTMLAWCEADLKNSKADWKILFFHEPVYDMSYRRTSWERPAAMKVFRENGVDLIFCGHAHSYQRFAPLYMPGVNDDHPITQIITAGGGKKYIAMPKTASPHLTVRKSISHFMSCRADKDSLEISAIGLDGVEFDKLIIIKSDRKLDDAYLALAQPETPFATIESGFRRWTLPKRNISAGEEFEFEVVMPADTEPYDFELTLDNDSQKVVEFVQPAKGNVTEGQDKAVAVKLRALQDIMPPEQGSKAQPLFWLECHYKSGKHTGIIASEPLVVPQVVSTSNEK